MRGHATPNLLDVRLKVCANPSRTPMADILATENETFLLCVDDIGFQSGAFDQYAAKVEFARRLAACWNACLEIDTITLERRRVRVERPTDE